MTVSDVKELIETQERICRKTAAKRDHVKSEVNRVRLSGLCLHHERVLYALKELLYML